MMGNFLHHSDKNEAASEGTPSPVIPKPVRPEDVGDNPTFLQEPIEGLEKTEDFAASQENHPTGPVIPKAEEPESPKIPNFVESPLPPSRPHIPEPMIENEPISESVDENTENGAVSEPQEEKEATLDAPVPEMPVADVPMPLSRPMVIEEPVVPEESEKDEEAPAPIVAQKEENSAGEEEEVPADESQTSGKEENKSEATADEEEKKSSDAENGEAVSEDQIVDYKSEDFLNSLFANGTTCLTAPSGTFPIKDETRAVLVLFSNGRFFVAESAKFDGKVLGFEYLARKRRLQIGKPEYVPTIIINDIYEYAAKKADTAFVPPTVELSAQEEVRMQRDFVTIVSRAAASKVSDIHIVVADHTTVMFRVNGLMQTEMEYNREWGESFVRSAFASADISDANYAQNEYQAAQKLGRTPLRGSGGKLVLPRNVLGIRLQFNPIAFGSRYVVMRLLYAEDDMTSAANLEALGFTPEQNKIFYEMRAIPTGMIVISGPTGSGKSTTLQRNMIAMLQERNYEINLITVEDPPEYPIPGARQMPVTNASIEEAKEREFTKALSAALRSDPDALMIGEIRTLSAADLAFRGALSGHNVWTTLHANSAPAVLMRLKDIGVENFKLQDPSLMRGLMAQRLFRKVCSNCRLKASDNLKHPAVERLRRAFGDVALDLCYLRGPGCEECDHRGVKGRTVVAEFIQPDATYLDLSIKGEFRKAQNYWINDLGGETLRDCAISHMLKGEVDIEEVEKWTGFLDQQVLV